MKHCKRILSLVLCFCLLLAFAIPANAASWRKTKSKDVRGHTLTARANLPYFSDLDGGGAWRTQACYSGSRASNKLTTSWSFYTIGGSVSWNGVGVSGSGSNSGSSYTCKSTVVNANGYVYGTGFCLYVGLISTASFTYGNTYYSISCKI